MLLAFSPFQVGHEHAPQSIAERPDLDQLDRKFLALADPSKSMVATGAGAVVGPNGRLQQHLLSRCGQYVALDGPNGLLVGRRCRIGFIS